MAGTERVPGQARCARAHVGLMRAAWARAVHALIWGGGGGVDSGRLSPGSGRASRRGREAETWHQVRPARWCGVEALVSRADEGSWQLACQLQGSVSGHSSGLTRTRSGPDLKGCRPQTAGLGVPGSGSWGAHEGKWIESLARRHTWYAPRAPPDGRWAGSEPGAAQLAVGPGVCRCRGGGRQGSSLGGVTSRLLLWDPSFHRRKPPTSPLFIRRCSTEPSRLPWPPGRSGT